MNFEFATATRIVFGPGKFSEAKSAVTSLGKRPFLVTGHSMRYVMPAEAAYLVSGEPTFESVRSALALARESECDVVAAFGGGSVIDTGKAVAMLLANGGDPLDYAEVIGSSKPIINLSVPFVAIPTTAGAGSEVTRNAVLASSEHKSKVSLRSPLMLPTVAVVDPELTYDLPQALTASTGMDALSQLIEAAVCLRANAMTDAICCEGIPRAVRSLRRVFADGNDRDARSDMSLASMFSGLALANAGLGAIHGFAAALGGMYNAPHGAVCAALLAPVTRMNDAAVRKRNPDWIKRFDNLSEMVSLDGLDDLTSDLEIPGLYECGVREEDFPTIIAKASASSSMKGNPVVLSPEELKSILVAAL